MNEKEIEKSHVNVRKGTPKIIRSRVLLNGGESLLIAPISKAGDSYLVYFVSFITKKTNPQELNG